MKKLLGIFIILIISFTSCEGRKTQRQALTEDIEEFNKNAKIEVNVYNPESYVEREVDTLLSNGYRIKIKTYSDMENSVIYTKVKDTINYQTHYRNYKFDILVEKDGKRIYFEHFNKEKMSKELGYSSNLNPEAQIYNFNKQAILKSVELNKTFNSGKAIFIDIAYAIPNTEHIDWHKLRIDEKGNREFITMQ